MWEGVGVRAGERKEGREGGLSARKRQVQQGEGGVQGRGKRHLATAGLNYPWRGCWVYRSMCVFASVCVCVCKVEASQGEGWDHWRQEGSNRSGRMKIIKILAGSWPWSCRRSQCECVWWMFLACHDATGCGRVYVCVCVCPQCIRAVRFCIHPVR